MVSIADVLEVGRNSGIFDFYLPFVLSFAIFYGLLERSKIFGDSSKDKKVRNINVVIAFSASLMIVVFTPLSALIHFLSNMFTQTFIAMVSLLSFILIFYMLVPPSKEGEENFFKKYTKHIAVIVAVIVMAIFISSSGFGIFPGLSEMVIGAPWTPDFALSTETQLIIALVIITIVVIWFLTKGEKEEKKKRGKIIGYRPGEPVPVYGE